MQGRTEHLSAPAAHTFLETIPEKRRAALLAYTAELEYPVEAVSEVAIVGFLDPRSLSSVNCQPLAGMNIDRKAS